ncbi:hypothetical protein OG562_23050 [Streptomyces sp. NBC_01275]|uniref:hypothetical protein n=1 Tax=Streptomyces sp. NBC_01275 TaxID=2903807 RepID=UPI00224DE899|nr:hypothetical protein [Streptomyces sp. NBC_01275]MCX4763791.1 hypothetical protein [Streptomyces sp. NBC_01275]
MSEEVEGRGSHERHEPFAWHEPMTPDAAEPTEPPASEPTAPHAPEPTTSRTQEPKHSQESKHSHAGNSTVNHRLDDQGPEGLDSDELALRRMLHQAVQEMEPSDGTLDHLRRAVPVRRARKRQAAVGMAAAALFIGTAVPAVLHVSRAGGSDANPSIAGQASQAQGGTSQGKGPDGGSSGKVGDSSGKTGEQAADGASDSGQTKGASSAAGTSSGADPAATASVSAPACTASQLGSTSADVAVADSAGIVYGTFRVVNVSSTACTVGGAVTMTTTAQGAADATKITVVQHASGDAAAALPDPSLYVSQLALAPGSAYDVKFAWAPSETCPTTGGGSSGGDTGGTSSPDPTPTDAAATTGDTTSGVSSQLLPEDGTADGSVLVSYTTEDGGTTVSATVSNACAGVVYRTGVLASS